MWWLFNDSDYLTVETDCIIVVKKLLNGYNNLFLSSNIIKNV